MAFSIPTYEQHIMPNHRHASFGSGSNQNANWIYHDSSTTLSHEDSGVRLISTPNALNGKGQSWEWWMAWEFKIDSAWPSSQGKFGTNTPDLHNDPRDVESIGWNWGTGVSCTYLRYFGGVLYLQHEPNSPNHEFVLSSNLSKGTWHSVLMHIIFGRTDGSVSASGHPNNGRGRTRIYLDGSDTPFDTGDINNLQRGTNPATGHDVVQTRMYALEGFYTEATPNELVYSHVAMRVGKSLSECLGDSDIIKVGEIVSTVYTGSGTNLGPSYYNILTSRQDTDFLLPPSLGGSTPPPVPTHTGNWTTAVQWNATAAATGGTVVEQHLGPWSTAVSWNAGNFLTAPSSSSLTMTAHSPTSLTLTPV